jgi:hypothetical protein
MQSFCAVMSYADIVTAENLFRISLSGAAE